jgi:hypothetical protein
MKMKDLHKIFTIFKEEFPEVHSRHESLGKEIHEEAGPLPEKIRWLKKSRFPPPIAIRGRWKRTS